MYKEYFFQKLWITTRKMFFQKDFSTKIPCFIDFFPSIKENKITGIAGRYVPSYYI